MKTRRLTCAVVILLLFAAVGGIIVVALRAANPGPQNADPSYGLIASPLNGDVLFVGDGVYIEASFLLSHRNLAGPVLYVDGIKYVLSGQDAQPYSGQGVPICPTDGDAFCGLVAMRTFWIPAEPGSHTLSACVSGDPAQGAAWTVCSDVIKVVVTDLALPLQIAGTYLPQPGDTLESAANKFGLPPLLVAAANSGIEPVALLPADPPINIPADPSLVEPAGGAVIGSPSRLDKVTMTVDRTVDKVYCYYSLVENYWTRLPAAPQTFAFPLSGQMDLTSHFRSVSIASTGDSLALECWGWSASSLVYLGSGRATIDPPTNPEVRAEHFRLTAVLASIPSVPSTMGGTPPPTPPPGTKLMPPINLRRTGVLDECINHFPPVFAEFFGTLACKGAVEKSQLILIWDRSIFPLEGYTNEAEGYKVYKTDLAGKLFLLKTIPDPAQRVLIFPPDSTGPSVPTYCVRTYLASLQSTLSCYTFAPEGMGLLSVTIPPVPHSENALSLHTTALNDQSYKCGEPGFIPFVPLGMSKEGTGIEPVPGGPTEGVNVIAGFNWIYNSEGCWEWFEQFFSGGVVFKLDAIKGPISKAVLNYKQGASVIAGQTAADGLAPGSSCSESLNVVTAVSAGDVSASDLFAYTGSGGFVGMTRKEDVTVAVRNWMLGEPNLGFVLISRPPAFGVDVALDQCWTIYDNFSLTATYFTK